MKKKQWSDKTILKSIPNPSSGAYEIKLKAPEVTFEGVRGQPDFALLYISAATVVSVSCFNTYFQFIPNPPKIQVASQ